MTNQNPPSSASPFRKIAERLALIGGTVRYGHTASRNGANEIIWLSTWPDSGCIVLSQARLQPLYSPPGPHCVAVVWDRIYLDYQTL